MKNMNERGRSNMGAYRCDWCGSLTEELPQIYIHHRNRPGVEYNPDANRTDTPICESCATRLANKMVEFRKRLGLYPEEHDEILVRQMVAMIDTLYSEPLGRDWEDTLP